MPFADSPPSPLQAPDSLSNLNAMVHRKEEFWFAVSVIWSLLIYASLLASLALFIYVPLFALMGLFTQGLWLGYIRGNAVRVSDKQFPEIMDAARRTCDKLGMAVPPIYVAESGGILNAFATRFLMKDYVVLYSETVEMAYEQGEDALAFVVAHEMAHIKRGHLKKHWLLLPALFTPFLGKAYYRACEYTCDRFGAHCVPQGAVGGILCLSAGKKLYKQVDAQLFSAQEFSESGFWIWFSEILSTHPRLPKRLSAVMAAPEVARLPRPDLLPESLSA